MKEERYFVGEIAKTTGLTVRTLQHYDNIGLLPVSGRTESGKRYYTKEDLISLEQIIFYKMLDFSLDEIKKKLIDGPTEIELKEILEQQEYLLLRKIEQLNTSFATIDASIKVIEAGRQPPFHVLLKFIKTLPGDDIFEWAPSKVSKEQQEVMSGQMKDLYDVQKFYHKWKSLLIEATALLHSDISPSSREGQELAGQWWDMLIYISGGDVTKLEQIDQSGAMNEEMLVGEKKMLEEANDFIQRAFDIYSKNNNIQLKEIKTND
ncbi:DNA-binding transcriptional MerR regulator [Mobilisporobacter senegalensis]|uniref:DNA-binding transcriptional MerR regulator n=1 Tax=Mobilisporobacter senegalensis TaxID=1329262 RepID=A0A3N1XKK4_9FIRM|nr:MerR family transcriptional regulator [Mobilisporobacter senegalensis]ROR27244.1 DNA-binding transcriptional MerR regulator [Mobilisporobacter senegalensis]